ncbi:MULTISPECIES: HAD hydrolase-like protein [unclassified Leptolyngbya]|uniref:HAD family hydrolase n=1 Tax=unclassified Leptolyngbya TaxID=2650499 RepID=UPI0016894E39|nr:MULTISPECIES: HAD hydrolase-like protein [unclassified Leptolyngbya]MBD1912959.1 HAD family hydrolase [Leptolyngbya sp. FACHB-8]MBD2157963.1 HAD family hydrolase [Leptolyngbya sp. FACHB-16]
MFDIDGTLVDSYGVDGDLFARAIRLELGVPVDETWQSYQQRTDSGVLEEVLVQNNVSVDERPQAFERVKSCFIDLMQDYIAKQPTGLTPISGAPELIRKLRSSSEVVIAFATGGWRETAEMKLSSVGIEFEGLPFATSSDAVARTEIMRLAERQAGVFGSFTRRTYFGDAPWDKKASADLGYDFLAVGGRVEHPHNFEDLSDLEAILGVLGV